MNNKMPAWEVVLNVKHQGLNRPRFFSLNTLAFLTRRRNLKKLAQEMKDSGRVACCYCPYVKTIVFYPKTYARGPLGHFGDGDVWHLVDKYLEKYPYPKVKGFADQSYWTGGSYGKGEYVANNVLDEPFINTDYAYANMVIDELIKAGYEPGIQKYKIG